MRCAGSGGGCLPAGWRAVGTGARPGGVCEIRACRVVAGPGWQVAGTGARAGDVCGAQVCRAGAAARGGCARAAVGVCSVRACRVDGRPAGKAARSDARACQVDGRPAGKADRGDGARADDACGVPACRVGDCRAREAGRGEGACAGRVWVCRAGVARRDGSPRVAEAAGGADRSRRK